MMPGCFVIGTCLLKKLNEMSGCPGVALGDTWISPIDFLVRTVNESVLRAGNSAKWFYYWMIFYRHDCIVICSTLGDHF